MFFFKKKTAYEMRIIDWSSDGCSSDLFKPLGLRVTAKVTAGNAELAVSTPSMRTRLAREGTLAIVLKGDRNDGRSTRGQRRLLGRRRRHGPDRRPPLLCAPRAPASVRR